MMTMNMTTTMTMMTMTMMTMTMTMWSVEYGVWSVIVRGHLVLCPQEEAHLVPADNARLPVTKLQEDDDVTRPVDNGQTHVIVLVVVGLRVHDAVMDVGSGRAGQHQVGEAQGQLETGDLEAGNSGNILPCHPRLSGACRACPACPSPACKASY